MLQLRHYQQGARESVWPAFCNGVNAGLIVLPTGSGKTPVIASICQDAVSKYDGRVLVLAHRKELLNQNESTIKEWFPDLDVGIYSAGLNRRELDPTVLIAGIQSIYKRAFEVGRRNLIIIDEAHLISPTDGTMYQLLLSSLATVNPNMRVLGLTATPYQLGRGKIYGPAKMFEQVLFEAPIAPLIEEGYLCPVVNHVCDVADAGLVDKVSKSRGDFMLGELADIMDRESVVRPACEDLIRWANDRHSILVFSVDVAHGEHVAKTLEDLGETSVEFISGETLPLERESILKRFKSGRLRVLVNCEVLTTGFDARRVDCVAVMRPTCSPGLFYQMVGRGFRLHESKQNCLLLDYGGNIQRHGPLDSPQYGAASIREPGGGSAPEKMCPECWETVLASARVCDCGYTFPVNDEAQHDAKADMKSAIMCPAPEWKEVESVSWFQHAKRGSSPSDPLTLRVEYRLKGQSLSDRPVCEWVCLEHDGFALDKACNWWAKHSDAPIPDTVQDAIDWKDRGAVAPTLEILVGPDPNNPRWNRISARKLGEKPAESEWRTMDELLDDVPF